MAQIAPQLVSVTLRERLALDPQIIDNHTEQIEFLKREIQKKNEAISHLNNDMKELREQNDDLKITVESKNRDIKALKEKIAKLESEKKELEKKLKSVEVELEAVKEEVVVLKEANKINEEKNAELQENVEKLSHKMEGIKKSLEETNGENTSLKRKIQDLQEVVQRKTAFGVPADRIGLPYLSDPVEGALLILGELCWRVQGMMYQKVHPNSYDEKKSYKVKHIDEDIEELEEETRQAAQKRWDELKKKLKWKKRQHTRAMKSIQESRNITAHPELNEEMLATSLDVMERAGRLTDWHNSACIKEFIEMWKKLK